MEQEEKGNSLHLQISSSANLHLQTQPPAYALFKLANGHDIREGSKGAEGFYQP